MKIGVKLTLSFFFVALIAMSVIGVIAFIRARNSLERESFNKLTAVREMKASQIEDYFAQIKDQILTLSEDPTIIGAMKEFRNGYDSIDEDLQMNPAKLIPINASLDSYFTKEYLRRLNQNLSLKATLDEESNHNQNGRILQELYISENPNAVGSKFRLDDPGDGSRYTEAHKKFHPVIRNYLKKFGYYDVFLVDDKTGNVVYTCFKEVDFGTSLMDGPFKNTNLAEAFNSARLATKKDYVKLVDFQPYHPSYNAHASFIAAPIYEDGEKIGVLIFQMPIDRINEIMTNKRGWKSVGLGETGETYIVGDDFTLRNQSRFLIEDSTNYFKMIREIGLPQPVIDKIRNFGSSIGLQSVKTTGTEEALKGITAEKIFNDYRGVPVFSSYKPLNIEGMHWAIMSEIDEAEAFSYVTTLRNNLIIAFIVLLFLTAAGSFIISRRITKPIKILTEDAMELARGNFEVKIEIQRKDEIGILAASFRKMQISIRNLIRDLKDINQNLEMKVEERTEEINKAKEVLEHQNKEILDSINYALRLQQAILPPKEKFSEVLKDSFVLFKPKDIVSGDFFWMSHADDLILLAVVDCTGHGVPGALVSMVGSSGLDRCVGEFRLRKPSDILDKLRELVIATFETKDNDVKDGMDITLISLQYKDRSKKKAIVNYSGANNPLWIRRNGKEEIEETKADKQPIGVFDFGKPFTNHVIEVEEGDCLYLFSDGYADQFGGPMGKKFRYKTLKNLLQSLNRESMSVHHDRLDETFESWKGELQQIDDVCVMGVRI